MRPRRLKLYPRGQWADVLCIPESCCCSYSSLLCLHFSFSPIFTHYNFCHTFLRNRGLEGWNLVHIWTVGRCIMYTGIRLLLHICSFISSFFFLSSFQTLTFFITLFSGTVRPRKLKLGTHVDSGQMYCVYQNQAAAAYLSLYFFIFLSLQFSNVTSFHQLFSGAVRPCRLNFGTHMDSGQMYPVFWNQATAAFLDFFIFLSLNFLSHFSQELWGLIGWNLIHK